MSEIRRLLAYRSKTGCRSVTCTRDDRAPERCFGWHCGVCDEPCSMQGHPQCEPAVQEVVVDGP